MKRCTLACLCVAAMAAFSPAPAAADQVNINFDTIMNNVAGSAVWPVVQTYEILPPYFTLSPAACDINGGFDISVTPIDLFPNGMLDSDEFALVAAILADASFDRRAGGGTSHGQVYDAWVRNLAQAWSDLGGGPNGQRTTLLNAIPDAEFLFAGMMTIGDPDTRAFPNLILGAIVDNETVYSLLGAPGMKAPIPEEYTLLFPWLGWCGDADGDGCSNYNEYQWVKGQGGGRAEYLAAAMDPAVHAPGCTNDRMCDGTGGLYGEYFATKFLTNLRAVRIDPQVTFDWGNGIPHPDLGDNDFSICWTGSVTPQFTEVYDFLVRTDDGVRLWVNGELLVDEWNDHGSTTYTGTTSTPLTAGTPYPIRMDFYEAGGDAVAWLGWESASQLRKGIYEMYLTPGNGIGDRGADWIRNPANGHYYKATPPMTWAEANTLAGQWGGHLVTINDEAENTWIQGTFGPLGTLYTGANDMAEEGRWVWAENGANFYNGTHAAGSVVPPWWVNWADAEPNDWNSSEDAGGVYGGTAGNAGRWNDWTPTNVMRALVETNTGRINLTGPTPASATLMEGNAISLRVTVLHPYGNVTYQWLKDGDPVPGAIGPVYNIAYAQLMDAGEYVCRVSDDSPATADSPAAVLTVNPRPPTPAASAAALAGLALALAALGARRRRT